MLLHLLWNVEFRQSMSHDRKINISGAREEGLQSHGVKKRVLVAEILPILLFSLGGFGQSNLATIGGTIEDSTGAVLHEVAITARNTATAMASTAQGNEASAPTVNPDLVSEVRLVLARRMPKSDAAMEPSNRGNSWRSSTTWKHR